MPAPTTATPTSVERRAFGDLADDVAYLRRVCMLIVAPFQGDYRIGVGRADDEVVDADGIRARAAAERQRRPATPPAKAMVQVDPELMKPLPATAHRRAAWRTKFECAPSRPLPKSGKKGRR